MLFFTAVILDRISRCRFLPFAGLRVRVLGEQLPLAHRGARDNESGRVQRCQGSDSAGSGAEVCISSSGITWLSSSRKIFVEGISETWAWAVERATPVAKNYPTICSSTDIKRYTSTRVSPCVRKEGAVPCRPLTVSGLPLMRYGLEVITFCLSTGKRKTGRRTSLCLLYLS